MFQLVTEGGTNRVPHNITTSVTNSSITIRWLPGYSGPEAFDQRHSVWWVPAVGRGLYRSEAYRGSGR